MNLKEVINNTQNLSPAPQVLPKLQNLLRSETADIVDIGALIKVDACLTAEVIRLGNCASFSGTSLCHSLEEAIGRIGFDEVYSVVSLAATSIVLDGEVPVYNLKAGELWEHSVTCAAVMETLMLRLISRETACHNTGYTIGLLHALGKVLINNYCLNSGIDLYGNEDEEPLLPEKEKRLLGFHYGEAGAALMKKWNFPESFHIPVEYQFTPLEAPDHKPLACLLHLSSWATRQFIHHYGRTAEEFDGDPAILKEIGCGEREFLECLNQAKDRLQEIRELFVIA